MGKREGEIWVEEEQAWENREGDRDKISYLIRMLISTFLRPSSVLYLNSDIKL